MAGETNIFVAGRGQYVTGYVDSDETDSVKGAGVVLPSLLELARTREDIGKITIIGTNGDWQAHRTHIDTALQPFTNLDRTRIVLHPAEGTGYADNHHMTAIAEAKPGDIGIVFTSDSYHFPIAMDFINAGMHTLITKPPVKTLDQHHQLLQAIDRMRDKDATVLVGGEYHKQFDPAYRATHQRMRSHFFREKAGDFRYFYARMTQPTSQVRVFHKWAGEAANISDYLNPHHVNVSEWILDGIARPESVIAMGSMGTASRILGREVHDEITLLVNWINIETRNTGIATYTACWAEPQSAWYSGQGFSIVFEGAGTITSQDHRGQQFYGDGQQFRFNNPFYFNGQPNEQGNLETDGLYGFESIKAFVDAATNVNTGKLNLDQARDKIVPVDKTIQTTAVIEAGDLSLHNGGVEYGIVYNDDVDLVPRSLAQRTRRMG